MVAPLPEDRPVPWPRFLTQPGTALHSVIGNQRLAALRVGVLGAYLGRGAMLLLASLIVQNPWLKLVGAAYLIRLAFNNLGQSEEGEENPHIHPIDTSSFWLVVLNVELADLVFSLDNVVAVVILSSHLWVIMAGVAIGIVMMRFAAGWFSYLVRREPTLETAAYLLVLIIGIELIYSEILGVELNDWLRFGISVATVLLCLAYAHSRLLRLARPVLVWFAQGMANINEVVDWLLIPIEGLFKLIWWSGKQLYMRTDQRSVKELRHEPRDKPHPGHD
ncbi:MAG TPA: hypothetical protein VMT46_19315 [Anaerolineaceae bacterium]|nr:hypothetical protein [Anaerolineaceae bacterium]